MERRLWILSIVAALAGAGLLQLHLRRVEQETSGGPKTNALVLVRDVPAGSTLTRDLLGHRGLPRAYLESRHVRARDVDQVIGAKLGVAGRASEALLWTDLAGVREPARSLSALVPEGMRAVPLAFASSAIDALLAPGDRIDVLLTPEQRTGKAEPEALTVAENLLVLAVGADLGGAAVAGRARGAARGRGVTVAASLAQSLRLAAAQRTGSLHLVLRNPDDLALDSGSRASSLPGGTGETHGTARSEN